MKYSVNSKIGKLTILKRLSKNKVSAQCECGNAIEVTIDSLRRTTSVIKSCNRGKCNWQFKDLSGKRFGFLTVQKFLEMKTGISMWECLCDCGNLYIVQQGSLTSNNTKSCGCRKNWLRSTNNTIDHYQAQKNNILRRYKSRAIEKLHIEFLLTKEQFESLINQPCYYCGSEFSSTEYQRSIHRPPFKYNGIDRKDPTKGYSIDNCVTACKHCNYAKRNLTHDEFIQLSKQIAMRF